MRCSIALLSVLVALGGSARAQNSPPEHSPARATAALQIINDNFYQATVQLAYDCAPVGRSFRVEGFSKRSFRVNAVDLDRPNVGLLIRLLATSTVRCVPVVGTDGVVDGSVVKLTIPGVSFATTRFWAVAWNPRER